MERAEVLLEKLIQQFQQKAGREQLMITLQLLQAEVMGLQQDKQEDAKARKISVIFPGKNNLVSQQGVEAIREQDSEEKIVEVLQVDEKEIEAELLAIKQQAELKNELSLKGRPIPEEFNDPMDEFPTLAIHHAYLPKDSPVINEEHQSPGPQVVVEEPSLNDKHKATTTELADRLQDSPVKDLKKAIGINDRYLYINELFNGNEAMFERTLKTLNDFSILPEAEFWIQRELKLKMGWKEENPLVQQFNQLVRRRFS
jgi:hypothetical protein